jgi:hypothetical protein
VGAVYRAFPCGYSCGIIALKVLLLWLRGFIILELNSYGSFFVFQKEKGG